MKDAGSQRTIHIGLIEDGFEVFFFAGTTRGDQRCGTKRPCCRQLFDIIAVAHPVLIHAIEHDLPRTAIHNLTDPVQRAAVGPSGLVRVTGELVNTPLTIDLAAVYAYNNALRTELGGQLVDKPGV